MSKKGKKVFALVEDFKAMITMVPKLEDFIGVYNDIAEGYRKYRKNGGAAIPGIEKHLGIKEKSAPSKVKESATITEGKTSKKVTAEQKTKKKVKK